MAGFETNDDLSQEELLCYKPADEIYHSYRKQAYRDQDLVIYVTTMIIFVLGFFVVGIFLWVNTRGWDLPRRMGTLPVAHQWSGVAGMDLKDLEMDERGKGKGKRRMRGDDIEGQAYSDTEKGHGHGRDTRSDTVEGLVERIRKLVVEEKVPWDKVGETIQRQQGHDGAGVRIRLRAANARILPPSRQRDPENEEERIRT